MSKVVDVVGVQKYFSAKLSKQKLSKRQSDRQEDIQCARQTEWQRDRMTVWQNNRAAKEAALVSWDWERLRVTFEHRHENKKILACQEKYLTKLLWMCVECAECTLVFIRLIAAHIIWKPEVVNRKSEAKSIGGHMAKTKKQGENSACSALFEVGY